MLYDISEKAEEDLVQVYVDGVQKHGQVRADSYWAGIFEQFKSLAHNPKLYHERLEIEPPVRVCPYGVHVIVYTVQDNDRAMIIRVRHGREDWQEG